MIYTNLSNDLQMRKYITENGAFIYLCEAQLRGEGLLFGMDNRNTYIESMKADPYFKVYNGTSYGNSSKVARISFSDPHYIHHKGYPVDSPLDSAAKKKMIKYITKENNVGWRELLEEFNKVMRGLLGDNTYNFYHDIPDYSKLYAEGGFLK